MAMTGISSDFDLDDHGILRDSFASDFHVDDDGILHDDLDLFKHAVNTAGHGTDSGIGGDKQSSTSTLQHLHASFDEDLAPIGDESINISDFEASRDDLDSFDGDVGGGRRSRSSRRYSGVKELDTPGSTLERPVDYKSSVAKSSGKHGAAYAGTEDQDLFTEDYYQQLRELGVLVDGADFSRDESQTEFEALESHLSREHIDYDENRDLIGEYLQNEYERERAEEERDEMDEKTGISQSHAGPSSRANSAPTISEQSFPEISPEDAERMYTEQEMVADDEIYMINHQMMPELLHSHKHQHAGTAPEDITQPHSRGSGSQTPHGADKRWHPQSRRSPSPGSGDCQPRSRSETNTPHKSRPDSVASHVSFASDVDIVPHPGSPPSANKALSKARSQESFFEQDRQQNKSADKVPKRMLPTPSTPDGNQSFRVKSKSKSVSNISGKATPVKPTHRSLSEVTMDQSGNALSQSGDDTHDRSEGELSTQLKQESSKRQQATELVQQLQKEYDSLLSKYALAELTIDQMRLGARVTLHADSPTPVSVQSGGAVSGAGHKPQIMQLPTPSAQRAVTGHFTSKPGNGPSLATSQIQTSDIASRSVAQADSLPAGGQGREGASTQGGPLATEDRTGNKTPRTAESVKVNLQTQAESLNDRLDQFHTLMENRQLTLEEQEKAFENIRTDHEKLRRAYLQAKEDYKVLKRSGASMPDFDNNKELEGHLFRLGMKFDEVHEKVDSNLKEQTAQRQPFHTTRLAQDQQEEEEEEGEDESTEQNQHTQGPMADSEDAEFEKRAEQLHEEYRALMDRYRRLKQMAPTPELDKETDNLVRKLNEICSEMPDMFRLAPELQERWDKLHRRDQRRSPLPSAEDTRGEAMKPGLRGGLPSVPSSPKVRGLPLVGDHSISPYLASRQGIRDGHNDESFHRTPSSLNASRSSMVSPTDRNSSIAAMRSSTTPSPQDRDQPTSPSSLDGAAAPRDRDRDSYDPRINRPRHHQHDFRDPKLSKMPDRGSYSSLPDSGISDQDAPRDRRPRDDALDQLPGPGTLKQLTHQRGDNDMDSGFIGSVVSSDGNHPHHRLPESPLRLRNRGPGDRHQPRSRQNSTDSTSTVGSVQREQTSDRRFRTARLPPTVPALVGINRSIDRSYDAELDESTLSDVHQSDTLGKLSLSQQSRGNKRGVVRRQKGEEGSGQSQSLRSMRSQSRSHSVHEGETLEDVSDGEMSDTTTPGHTQAAEDAQGRRLSAHSMQASPRSMYRPPTPHRPPTPQRPPTPYRSEHGDREGDRVEAEEEAPELSRMRAKRPSADEVMYNRTQQLRSRSPPPPAFSAALPVQRPESRGEPTTDLFHTRPTAKRIQEREHIMSARSSKSSSVQGGRGREEFEPMRGEERGVGSDVEIRSDATRGSSINSGRLRALQDEIEKLKEGVKQAHKASERVIPPQLPPPPQNEGPEYYDPFDDPYGFMRMPLRRANSFSGGRVRDYDDWYWSHPNGKKTDDADLPLGYAAADSYNRHHHDKTPEAARQRLRRRGERRRRGKENTEANTVEDGRTMNAADMTRGVGVRPLSTGAPPLSTLPSRPAPQIRAPPDPQALYNYYIPSRSGAQPIPVPNANPYRQHTTPLSASQPNLSSTLAGVEPSSHQYQTQTKRPWYTIRRAQGLPKSGSGQYFPTLGHQGRGVVQQPVCAVSPPQQPASNYYAVPQTGQSGVGYRLESCPLCGGAGAHIHEEDVEPVHGYMAQDFATQPGYNSYHRRRRHEPQSRGRRRSRSASRSRHYTPERSSSRSRYLVREFGESISDESDAEYTRGRRRTRSLSRSRGHSETRSSSRRSSSRSRGRRYRRDVESLDSDDDVDLNESLVLSEDINRLTRRMMGTVQGELRRYRNRKEFGSAQW